MTAPEATLGDQILAATAEEPEPKKPRLIVRSTDEFLEREFPKIEPIAGEIFLAPQLVMLYARPGVGKTFFSMTFAIALALGDHLNFCGWRIGKDPLPVLYIDGEMDGEELQERMRRLLRGSARWPSSKEPPISWLSRSDMIDATGHGIPDLADAEGRDAIDEVIEQVKPKVVVLDNLSSLVIKGDESSSEDWAEINQWLLRLRAQGLHVMMVHHAGKNGSQRGASKREDNVNLIVRLEHPDDYQASDLGRFVLTLDKVRRVSKGSQVQKREIKVIERYGGYWLEESYPDADTADRVLAAYESGTTTPTEIAKQLGINKSTASRHLARLKEQKKIT